MRSVREWIINDDKDINRSACLWNMIGTILMSLQSVVMIAVINRVCDLSDAGVFTIAVALANQFLMIGQFSMRTFQASDVNDEFTFQQYLNMRFYTVGAMMIISLGYALYMLKVGAYDLHKSMVVMGVCLLKCVDAIEDVLNGRYHQRGRLDIAAKCQTLRQITTIMAFVIILLISADILISVYVTCVFSCIVMAYTTGLTKREYLARDSVGDKKIIELFAQGFPLFANAFILTYIGNISKYSIDKNLSEEQQAIFGFIFMPVFALNLLSGLIYNPFIGNFSYIWNCGDKEKMVRAVVKYTRYIVLISMAVLFFASFLGCPVLSLFYNINLASYHTEFMVLMVGSAFFALIGFANVILTVMRQQKLVLMVTLISAIGSRMVVDKLIMQYELMGAACCYVLSVAILAILMYCCLAICLMKMDRKEEM